MHFVKKIFLPCKINEILINFFISATRKNSLKDNFDGTKRYYFNEIVVN